MVHLYSIGALALAYLCWHILVATWPLWPLMMGLFFAWCLVLEPKRVVSKAIKATVEPALIAITVVTLLQLVLNTVHTFRNPEAVGAIEFATLKLNEAFGAITRINSWVLAAAIAVLWGLATFNDDRSPLTSFSTFRKRLGRVAAVVAIVSSFTFATHAFSLPRLSAAAFERVRARYVNDIRKQRIATGEVIALQAIERAMRAVGDKQLVYVFHLMRATANIAPDAQIDTLRAIARWTVEEMSSVQSSHGALTFYHDNPVGKSATELKNMIDSQAAAAASAEALRKDTRSAVETLANEVFSGPNKFGRESVRNVVDILLGMIDADLGIANKLVSDFANKIMVDEAFKRASSEVINDLSDKLIARTRPPSWIVSTNSALPFAEDAAMQRVRSATANAAERFIHVSRRVASNAPLDHLAGATASVADNEVIELDKTALTALHGDELVKPILNQPTLGKALSELEGRIPSSAIRRGESIVIKEAGESFFIKIWKFVF